MIRRPPRSTQSRASAASDVYKRQDHEYEWWYPEMIETARIEKQKSAEMSFYDANEVEKVHSQLFNKLLANQGKSTETFPYYVCPICGNTVENEPPEKCQVCGTEAVSYTHLT